MNRPLSIREALTDDLRRPPWRGSSNRMAGHCYVATEVAFHRLKYLGIHSRPHFIRHEGQPHWYLVYGDGHVLDYTAEQFATPVPYHKGKGKGFLTKAPSKRARLVMERLNWKWLP